MKGLMIQGTSSDSGKSFIVTALCRLFSDMGYNVCPFKSQNMSNNSCVTVDGKEMGRAQGVQAEAARHEPEVYMNPILLKPRKDTSSEIVLLGKVWDAPCDKNYYRSFTMTKGLEVLRSTLKYIENNFDLIISEGAGSPAEINLNKGEIVNMRVANEADIPVVLITDVDRGGSLASIVGTLELLEENKSRVKGIIFNKFRGDISLFTDAVEWLEKKTGVKVLGVMPYLKDIVIEAEDVMSINWDKKENNITEKITIGVVKFPRVSNHTDIEAFRFENDVKIEKIDNATSFDTLDAIILPGTKSSVLDMKYLTDTGLAEKIKNFASKGGIVYGICGGYQMMGEKIDDNNLKDNESIKEINGLGLLPVTTTFENEKTTIRSDGKTIHPYFENNIDVKGYEIHFGKTVFTKNKGKYKALLEINGKEDGASNENFTLAGSYLHNIFHNDTFRNKWLNKIRKAKGIEEQKVVDSTAAKERAYDILAEELKKNIDIDYLTKEIMKL
ncbi:MAG: cobyric acid synthase [Synergistaceae bacterium]